MIVPGVRKVGERGDDHADPYVECPDADYLVIGRPITRAADPAAAYLAARLDGADPVAVARAGTVPDVLDAVTHGEVDFGFVPIENSIEGTVNRWSRPA